MPVEVLEKLESRQVTTGNNPSVELRYTIRGTNDDVEARSNLVATAPSFYDPYGGGWFFLPRDTITVQPVGDLLWEGIVRYGTIPPTNESVFSFDTGGGTQHITQSLQTVESYAPSGQTAPDFKGAIGVTADSVEGVDIYWRGLVPNWFNGCSGMPGCGSDCPWTLAEVQALPPEIPVCDGDGSRPGERCRRVDASRLSRYSPT